MKDTLLRELTSRLSRRSETAALDASVLLADVLRLPRSWVVAEPSPDLSTDQRSRLETALVRLESGEPLPYVLGHWEFFGLEFEVSPDVLIPRPETELLVEKALTWLAARDGETCLADIGTGSGCISIAIAVHHTDVRVVATDISAAALDVARRNAERHGVKERIEFVHCDLFPTGALAPKGNDRRGRPADETPRYDLICANLPYIPSRTLRELEVFGREPSIALDGGDDGLQTFRRCLALARTRATENGAVLFEIEATQGPAVLALAARTLPATQARVHRDLAGHERLLEIQLGK